MLMLQSTRIQPLDLTSLRQLVWAVHDKLDIRKVEYNLTLHGIIILWKFWKLEIQIIH